MPESSSKVDIERDHAISVKLSEGGVSLGTLSDENFPVLLNHEVETLNGVEVPLLSVANAGWFNLKDTSVENLARKYQDVTIELTYPETKLGHHEGMWTLGIRHPLLPHMIAWAGLKLSSVELKRNPDLALTVIQLQASTDEELRDPAEQAERKKFLTKLLASLNWTKALTEVTEQLALHFRRQGLRKLTHIGLASTAWMIHAAGNNQKFIDTARQTGMRPRKISWEELDFMLGLVGGKNRMANSRIEFSKPLSEVSAKPEFKNWLK